MADHDQMAELRGLRTELELAQNGPRRESRKSALSDIKAAIERVAGELKDRAAALEKRAEQLLAEGRDALAGEARELAREIRQELADLGVGGKRPAPKPAGTAGKQAAVLAPAPNQT